MRPFLLLATRAADLVDELCLAISPMIAGGGQASRVTAGTTLPTVDEVSLTAAYEAEEFVFLRYGRAG